MSADRTARGGFVQLDGEDAYRIEGVDRLPPFLMNIASDSDLWMFVTSRGGLTAGRTDPDGALFPYETADKLNDAHHHTGPITLLRVRRGPGAERLWQPFSPQGADDAGVERNLIKTVLGNRVVFEEIHRELALVFRAGWAAADGLGWVRTVHLENLGDTPVAVRSFGPTLGKENRDASEAERDLSRVLSQFHFASHRFL